MTCNIVNVVSDDWCHMGMRPARLVSYAFLYTTDVYLIFVDMFVKNLKESSDFKPFYNQTVYLVEELEYTKGNSEFQKGVA